MVVYDFNYKGLRVWCGGGFDVVDYFIDMCKSWVVVNGGISVGKVVVDGVNYVDDVEMFIGCDLFFG